MTSNDDDPDPRIGSPQPPLTFGELVAWHVYMGTLPAFLASIGWWVDHPSPGHREIERKKSAGRER